MTQLRNNSGAQSTLKDVPCNLCGSNDTQVIYTSTIRSDQMTKFECNCTCDGHGEYYQLVRCRRCGLYYSSPRPDGDALREGYSDVQDIVYQEEIEGRVKTFGRNLKHLARYKQKGELLDVGSSIGVFLSEARKQGWDVYGIEPSAWCADRGKKLFHLAIRQGTSHDLKTIGRKFDVVTLWDVLEHVDDPLTTLRDCRDALKEGGVLAFSTVDIGSIYVRLLGKRWPWLMKMHIYYFDKKSIKKYLEKAGLELLEIRTYQHTVSIDYLLYKFQSINKLLFQITKWIKRVIFLNKNIYMTIGMGDFMEVYAGKHKE
jgi:2-polyprenyl-3-methyl-5-hydroxy-6-metoxy-1,4-benzoquinol methylase